ncbi:MAG: ABC transporter ATP-binding protein [Hydrogenophilaceae bacterium]
MALVELRQVCKRYTLGETSIDALKNVDLDIEPGEFIAAWGPSGSGKSTLCNLIGLLDEPTSGQIRLEGQDPFGISDMERSRLRNCRIGFVFQGFNLVPVLSALDNVLLPLQIRGRVSQQDKAKALHYLKRLGLDNHIGHRPQKLSGGQQQRVAIARALITEPALVIADEPTANLDSVTAAGIIALMRDLNRQQGTTFLFSTHDQRLIQQVDRLIHLRDGAIEADDRLAPEAGPAVQSCAA